MRLEAVFSAGATWRGHILIVVLSVVHVHFTIQKGKLGKAFLFNQANEGRRGMPLVVQDQSEQPDGLHNASKHVSIPTLVSRLELGASILLSILVAFALFFFFGFAFFFFCFFAFEETGRVIAEEGPGRLG